MIKSEGRKLTSSESKLVKEWNELKMDALPGEKSSIIDGINYVIDRQELLFKITMLILIK